MRHHLLQRDVGLAARGEFRQVIGDLVHEGQLAFLDQGPDRGTGQHLGLAEQQEQVVVGRRHLGGLGLGVAIGAEQRKLAVPRQRDLRAGIAAFLDMLLDQPVEMIERLRGEAETGGIAGRQRIVTGHGRFSSHSGKRRCYAGRRLRPTGGSGGSAVTVTPRGDRMAEIRTAHLMTLPSRSPACRRSARRRTATAASALSPAARSRASGCAAPCCRRRRLDHRAPRWFHHARCAPGAGDRRQGADRHDLSRHAPRARGGDGAGESRRQRRSVRVLFPHRRCV